MGQGGLKRKRKRMDGKKASMNGNGVLGEQSAGILKQMMKRIMTLENNLYGEKIGSEKDGEYEVKERV